MHDMVVLPVLLNSFQCIATVSWSVGQQGRDLASTNLLPLSQFSFATQCEQE